MQRLELKPTHKPVQNYYAALRQFDDLGVIHETAVRSAFQGRLDHCARQHNWTLVPEWEIRRPRQHPLRVDGALLDNFRLTHGFWEAKDSRDDLPKEARKKFDLGSPRDIILFQERVPERACGLIGIIERERQTNRRLPRAFADFTERARRSIKSQKGGSQPS